MSSAYEIDIVLFQKLGNLVLAKCVAYSSIVFAPVLDILVWITPQEVAKHAFIRHVCGPSYFLDVLDVYEVWTESPVHTEDLLLDQG